jgi:hypothetical protein
MSYFVSYSVKYSDGYKVSWLEMRHKLSTLLIVAGGILLFAGIPIVQACTVTQPGGITKMTVTATITGSNPSTDTGYTSYSAACLPLSNCDSSPLGICLTDSEGDVAAGAWYSDLSYPTYFWQGGAIPSTDYLDWGSGTVGHHLTAYIIFNGCENNDPFIQATMSGSCTLVITRHSGQTLNTGASAGLAIGLLFMAGLVLSTDQRKTRSRVNRSTLVVHIRRTLASLLRERSS